MFRICIIACLASLALADLQAQAADPSKATAPHNVRFTDGSTFKVFLKEATIEIATPYGKLLVPVSEIERIEFATRLTDDASKRIEEAVANLAHPQFSQREAASGVLLKFGGQAFPALAAAAKNKDAEVAKRAEDLIEKIREATPPEQLEFRRFDVIHTDHSKLSGRIEVGALKASSVQFGDVQLKLTDLRNIRAPGVAEDEVKVVDALADPGTLANYQDKVGKTLYFTVTGAINSTIWGTDVYTTDSSLATAAVHAGVLRNGQTGVVKVTIVASPIAFTGSTRHNVTSQPYGIYPSAYKIGR